MIRRTLRVIAVVDVVTSQEDDYLSPLAADALRKLSEEPAVRTGSFENGWSIAYFPGGRQMATAAVFFRDTPAVPSQWWGRTALAKMRLWWWLRFGTDKELP